MAADQTTNRHHETTFSTSDNLKLYQQWWEPEKPLKAMVAIVHGLHEHSGRYAHVADHLTGAGYGVRTFDLRGHGKSEGIRGYTPSFDHFLDDLDIFMAQVRDWQPGKPLFLLGHSMGGLVVASYVVHRKPDLTGVLLSGAALRVSDDFSPFLIRISSLISKLFPKLSTIKLDSSFVSSDPDVVKRYQTDPLNYNGGTIARTGAEIISATRRLEPLMASFALPVLIMHGTYDRLTDPQGSVNFHNAAASEDKTLKLYNGFYHEIMNEPEQMTVFNDITAWLDQRV